MAYKRFKIGIDSGYYFVVHIYKSRASMRRAYRKLYPYMCNQVEAVCCPVEGYDIDKSGKSTKLPNIGDILIYDSIKKKWAVVAHELLHAAMHYEVFIEGNRKKKFYLGRTPKCSEERLAYRLMDLMIDYQKNV